MINGAVYLESYFTEEGFWQVLFHYASMSDIAIEEEADWCLFFIIDNLDNFYDELGRQLPDITIDDRTECWAEETEEGLVWTADFSWLDEEDSATFDSVLANIMYYHGDFDEEFLETYEGYLLPSEADDLYFENPDHWLFNSDSEMSDYYQFEAEDSAYDDLETDLFIDEDANTFELTIYEADYNEDILD